MPDTTNTPCTLRDVDGMAVIGRTPHQLRGIRHVEGEDGAGGAAGDGKKDDTPAEKTEGVDEDEQLGDAGKSALAKERAAAKAATKRAADAEAELQKLRDKDKTEAQLVQDERDRLKTENDTLQLDILRRDVAADKGLTPAQAKRLVGTTRDELEADADEVLKDFPTTAASQFGDVSQGHRGSNASSDPRTAFAAALGQAMRR